MDRPRHPASKRDDAARSCVDPASDHAKFLTRSEPVIDGGCTAP